MTDKITPHGFHPLFQNRFKVTSPDAKLDQLPAEILDMILQHAAALYAEESSVNTSTANLPVMQEEIINGEPVQSLVYETVGYAPDGQPIKSVKLNTRARFSSLALICKRFRDPVKRILFAKVVMSTNQSFEEFLAAVQDGMSDPTVWQPLRSLREMVIQRSFPDKEDRLETGILWKGIVKHCVYPSNEHGVVVDRPRPITLTIDKEMVDWLDQVFALTKLEKEVAALKKALSLAKSRNNRKDVDELTDRHKAANDKIKRLSGPGGSAYTFDLGLFSKLHVKTLIVDGASQTSGQQPGHALPQVDWYSITEFASRLQSLETLVLRQVFVVALQEMIHKAPVIYGLPTLEVDRAYWTVNTSRSLRDSLISVQHFSMDGRGKRETHMFEMFYDDIPRNPWEERGVKLGPHLKSLALLWTNSIWNNYCHLSHNLSCRLVQACDMLSNFTSAGSHECISESFLSWELPRSLQRLELQECESSVLRDVEKARFDRYAKLKQIFLTIQPEAWDDQRLNAIGEKCRRMGITVTVDGDMYGSQNWPLVDQRSRQQR